MDENRNEETWNEWIVEENYDESYLDSDYDF